MTNEEFLDQIIVYYEEARHLTCENLNGQIKRGKNHTISGMAEDLFALWLAKKINDNSFEFWVDKPISLEGVEGKKSMQPDIFTVKDDIISTYFDVKMDFGWNRNARQYLEDKNNLIADIRGKKCKYKIGNQEVIKCFSEKITYQLVVLSGKNISNEKLVKNIECSLGLPFVELYILSGNQHLNMYKKKQERAKLEVYHETFERIIEDTKHILTP